MLSLNGIIFLFLLVSVSNLVSTAMEEDMREEEEPSVGTTASSVYNDDIIKYGPQYSFDGAVFPSGYFFHSKKENYPWLEIELPLSTKMSSMTIVNRKDCCGERLKNVEIRAGMNSVPAGTSNRRLKINTVCGIFNGPGATGTEYNIACASPILAKFITIQLIDDHKGFLQVSELKVNGQYRQYSDSVWEERQNIFNDDQCSNIGWRGLDISSCKKACDYTKNCSAFNWKLDGTGCILRACPFPIKNPNWEHSGYKSYFRKNKFNALNEIKNVYKSCIQKSRHELCKAIITTYLPKLMESNIMKEGDIGVDDGKLASLKGKERAWLKTLTLQTGKDIITSKTNNQFVTINGTVNGYIRKRNYGHMNERPTGLYADRGDIITITIPETLVDKLKVTIGHWFAQVHFSLKKSVCQIGSPWGGLINFRVLDKDATKGEFRVKIDNAIKAPAFIYGQDNNEEWNREIKKYSPKWSVLRIPGQLDVYVRTIKIKTISDMEGTLAKWKNTMDILEGLFGFPANFQPGAVIISLLPYDTGYHTGACTPGTTVVGDQNNNDFLYGNYGISDVITHEMGHDFCHKDLPWGYKWFGTTEQWLAEMVASYVKFKKGLQPKNKWRAPVPTDMDFGLLYRMVAFALFSNEKACEEAKFNTNQLSESNLDLCTRWLNEIPIMEFGWDTLRKVYSLNAESTKSYKSKFDRMVDLYCQATQHNLIPLFNLYNIKVSKTVSEDCDKLPKPIKITQILNVANCVKESMELNGNKDMKDCSKLPQFPSHKGVCLLSGVCHNDKAYNGIETKMINKYDLFGSSYKGAAQNRKKCLKRARATFQDCKNNVKQKNEKITATFVPSNGKSSSTYIYPPPDSVWEERQKIFTDKQCPNIGWRVVDIPGCKKACDDTPHCSAFNVRLHGTGCILRACPFPIQNPNWKYSGYKSYFKKSQLMVKF